MATDMTKRQIGFNPKSTALDPKGRGLAMHGMHCNSLQTASSSISDTANFTVQRGLSTGLVWCRLSLPGTRERHCGCTPAVPVGTVHHLLQRARNKAATMVAASEIHTVCNATDAARIYTERPHIELMDLVVLLVCAEVGTQNKSTFETRIDELLSSFPRRSGISSRSTGRSQEWDESSGDPSIRLSARDALAQEQAHVQEAMLR